MKTIHFYIIAILVAAIPARAGLVASALADKLELRAAAVVVGTITTVTQDNSKTVFQIRVDRVLKGAVSRNSTITVTTTIPLHNGAASVPTIVYERVWFLESGTDGGYGLLPAKGGDILHLVYAGLPAEPGPPAGTYAARPTDAAIDLIVKEVCTYAEKEQDSDGDEAVIQAFGETNTPTFHTFLQNFARSTVPVLRAMGTAGLIQRGEVTSLAQAEIDLQGLLSGLQNTYSMVDLMAAIEFLYRNPDPQGIAVLGRLASSATQLRKPSAYALRAIHTKETLPWLLKLLDSPDADDAYDALMGIAGFANGMPTTTMQDAVNLKNLTLDPNAPFSDRDSLGNMPNAEMFVQNRAEYVGFWKNWFAANQARIQALN